jgi:aspartyl/glutamyl-tRNA(Asn/Gln) amidotransferase C subunit
MIDGISISRSSSVSASNFSPNLFGSAWKRGAIFIIEASYFSRYYSFMKEKNMVDVKNLAKLARIEVGEGDLKTLEEQIPSILAFVARIQEVSDTAPLGTPKHHSVMRDDAEPHESGKHTEVLLEAAPKKDKQYVQVPQVIKGGKHT